MDSSFVSYDPPSFLFETHDDGVTPEKGFQGTLSSAQPAKSLRPPPTGATAQEKKKRRRRPTRCKNKEEAETQRMNHIAVERNRRRLMNEHLAVLRSLMPDSFVQRGDQASIVGGAINFVKELEHLLQSLEAQKRTLEQQQKTEEQNLLGKRQETEEPPFARFFAYPQYMWCHTSSEQPPAPDSRPPAVADIEVTLIETHANIRILSPRRPRQLIQMVAGIQALSLSILHLNVTTVDFMVLYSLSLKVEDGCRLTTVDAIATAMYHMLSSFNSETPALCQLNTLAILTNY
ncbi:hypothetical protein HPP92_020562 [Vanilla planifolia]|uniref:BHLH domain-containing protein n=1 Tax=Vanilla planifolia TaxID=51239 RepID=A0A835UJW6_VANPL|nr:hypothetical protein HPP92_020963 [Vanilla planifolia]KAG0462086.1 hypothetical protein HPP92_020562 [Vanilla planifolia]